MRTLLPAPCRTALVAGALLTVGCSSSNHGGTTAAGGAAAAPFVGAAIVGNRG